MNYYRKKYASKFKILKQKSEKYKNLTYLLNIINL